MTTSLCLHDVTKITLTRKSATQSDGRNHNWTTLLITHRASGDNAEGEYGDITVESEIVLHHFGLDKVPFKITRAGS